MKLGSEYGSVLKEVNEAKRKKEEELLKLPKNPTNVGASSDTSASNVHAVTAGAAEATR